MPITAKTQICLVIGDPVAHSLSPVMHNATYKAVGLDDQFIFVAEEVKPTNLKSTLKVMRELCIRGISCTIPHKVEVMKYLDEIDSVAKKIGAVNTIVNEGKKLKGYNTDWLGIVIPLEKITSLKNKKVALIGAGGAARAICYGVKNKGAILTIYNRTKSKAEELARDFQAEGRGFDSLSEVKNADIIINATSVGLKGKSEKESPVPVEYLNKNQIVFDVIYTPYETELLKSAKAKGATIIHGTEMLLYQGMAQFVYYTDYNPPEKVMREAILAELQVHKVKNS